MIVDDASDDDELLLVTVIEVVKIGVGFIVTISSRGERLFIGMKCVLESNGRNMSGRLVE